MSVFVVNGISLAKSKTSGIHRNTFEILKSLDKIIHPGEIELIIPENAELNYSFSNITVLKKGKNPYSQSNKMLMHIYHYIWVNHIFKKCCKNKISIDSLLVFPSFGCDVIYIYDCIPELMPENYNTRKLKRSRISLLFRQRRAIKKCKIIITDSYSSKMDIARLYNVDKDRIYVVYCAWQHFENTSEDDSILNELGLKCQEYCFSLGSQFIHKNMKWILAAAKNNPEYKFVISGVDISNVITQSHLPENVLFSGYLSDEKVKSLMKNCKVFIQPSLYEGFGIPPMEAMSVGAKCIISNVSSLPEVYNDSVWYIDPYDYENINIDNIILEEKEENEKVLNLYSWDKSAGTLLHILRSNF